MIELTEEDTKHQISLLDSFDENEIGGKMTTNCINLQEGISVREAVKELANQTAENNNISTIYVNDKAYLLVGDEMGDDYAKLSQIATVGDFRLPDIIKKIFFVLL